MKDSEPRGFPIRKVSRRTLLWWGGGLALSRIVGCDDSISPKAEFSVKNTKAGPILTREAETSSPTPVIDTPTETISPNLNSNPSPGDGKFVIEPTPSPVSENTPEPTTSVPQVSETPTVTATTEPIASGPITAETPTIVTATATAAPRPTLTPIATPEPVRTAVPQPTQTVAPTPTPEALPKAVPTSTPEILPPRLNKELPPKMVLRINEERRKLGLPEVTVNANLTTAEEGYVRYLYTTKQYAHNLDGTLQQRADRSGYVGFAVSEVLAVGNYIRVNSQYDPVSDWMVSPAHKEILMRPGRWEIGPAVFQGDPPSGINTGIDYVICGVLFGTPTWPPRQ